MNFWTAPDPYVTMDLDDDAPPELIDTGAAADEQTEEVTVKVPITIVTGMYTGMIFFSFYERNY